MEMAVRSMETAETAMETDGHGSGGTSPSRQGAGTETSVPQNLSSTAAALRNCSGKTLIVLGFSVPRLYIGEGVASGGDQGGLTTRGSGQPWPRPLMVRLAPSPPSGSLSVLVLRPGKIGVLGLVSSNSENISCVTFLKQQKQQKIGNWYCGILSIG
jgi:hypothetical protein